MADDIFAKIIRRELPATIRYEDDDFIVINDIHPGAPVHVLIIPKHDIATLEDVSLDDVAAMGKLLQTARKVARLLKIEQNYKLFMNVGKNVQAVHRVHLHLMGGWDLKKQRPAINLTEM